MIATQGLNGMENISSIENKHQQDPIIIVGNGPSLSINHLNSIANRYTLAMNKIDHLYDSTSWRPTYYLNSASKLDRNNRKSIQININEDITCFINSKHKSEFGTNSNINYIDFFSIKNEFTDSQINRPKIDKIPISILRNYWSDDISNCVYTYHSMYSALQIVSYMGFNDIYLIGADLNFGYHDPHMIFGGATDPLIFSNGQRNFIRGGIWPFLKESAHKRMLFKSLINTISFELLFSPLANIYYKLLIYLEITEDENHFSSTYAVRPKDFRYVNDETVMSHLIADRILKNKDINVYNATSGGNLEVYPRVNILDISMK